MHSTVTTVQKKKLDRHRVTKNHFKVKIFPVQVKSLCFSHTALPREENLTQKTLLNHNYIFYACLFV